LKKRIDDLTAEWSSHVAEINGEPIDHGKSPRLTIKERTTMSVRKGTWTTRQKSETAGKPLNDKRHTAYHEAGHAVIGRVLGMNCGCTTIEADEEGAGYSTVEDPYETQGWEEIGKFREIKSAFTGRVMTFMAGREAEVEFFGRSQGGDGNDRRQIALMLKEISAASKESRLRKKTRALVKRHRIKVEAIARELIKSKRLSARKIDAIIRRTSSPSELAIAKRVYNSADRVKMRERFSLKPRRNSNNVSP
jgi:hypothetical protein